MNTAGCSDLQEDWRFFVGNEHISLQIRRGVLIHVHFERNDPPVEEFNNFGNQRRARLSMSLRMRTLIGSALALMTFTGLTTAPAIASADTFHGTRSEKLIEKTHKIDIQLGHGYADLRVRRTVYNGGPRHDQATFYIDMPDGSVAIGLRTLGVLDGQPHWFAGELLEAEAAAARYRELTGIGGYYPKDPALLSWRSQSRLALQVFPCAPGENKTIEYTLRVPTEYRDGRHHLQLPSMGTETLFAQASVSPMTAGESIYIDNKPVSAPGWVHLKQEVDLSVAPNTTNLLDGAVASLPVNAQKNIVHYHIDAAPRLGKVPAGAHVVVLVDASRSLTDTDTKAELAMARAFVGHFPEGRIAIVPFDRKIRNAKGFISVGQARLTLKTMEVDRQNGSHVDMALAQADALLANAPTNSARRILLLTDTRTRNELTPELLKSKLAKSGALLHIGVAAYGNDTSLKRNDDHAWNAVARSSGGLVWDAELDTFEANDESDKVIFEEWARPKRIDHFAVHAEGLENEVGAYPNTLDEGQGIADLHLPKTALNTVKITGELWATPLEKVFGRDDAENQRWAGLFFGTSSYSEITEEEMMPLAMLGKVVSPVTSYLAIEPGVRPSTEGLDEFEGSGFGIGFGSGRSGGVLRGAGTMRYPDGKEAFLRRELDKGLTKCGGQGRHAKTTLETTLAEIVAVQASIEGEAATSTLSKCFEESIWELYLRSDFREDHEVFNITL